MSRVNFCKGIKMGFYTETKKKADYYGGRAIEISLYSLISETLYNAPNYGDRFMR